MRIIGLGYKAKSGKDTLAGMLARGHGFMHFSFAEPLKKVCAGVFGFTNAQVYGGLKEAIDEFWGFAPRKAMQLVGTECFKPVFGDDVWVRAMERHIFDPAWPYSPRVVGVVISDVRFRVEAEAIKRWGGKVVRVDRHSAGASGGVANHASETELDTYADWDAVIDNNGTLEDLEAKAAELAR